MTKLTGSTYTKVALVVALCLVLCGGLLGCSTGCGSAWYNAQQQFEANFEAADFENVGSAEVDSGGIRNITVQWASGGVDVAVRNDDTDTIKLTETAPGRLSEQQQMRWRVQGDTLQIAYGWERSWLFGCSATAHKQLTIELPKRLAADLGAFTLQAASGTYDLGTLGCETLNIDLASGQVNGADMRADNLRMNVASGLIDLKGAFVEQIVLDAASGNISIASTACPASADLTLLSGNVDIALPADSSFTADVKKLSGSLDCSFPTAHGKNTDSYVVVGSGDSRFAIDITSGNVSLQEA